MVSEMMKIMFPRIRELRKSKGLTQEEFAPVLNMSRASYSYIESGSRELNIETLIKLSKFFNVSTDYILGLDDALRYKEEPYKIYDKGGSGRVPVWDTDGITNPTALESKVIGYVDNTAGVRADAGIKMLDDSMSPDFPEACIALYVNQGMLRSGEIGLMWVWTEDKPKGELIIRRYEMTQDMRVKLTALNAEYKPIILPRMPYLYGKVVGKLV